MVTLTAEQKKVAKEKFELPDRWITFVEKFIEQLNQLNPKDFECFDPQFRYFKRASQAVKNIIGTQYDYTSIPSNVKSFISHLGGKKGGKAKKK